ncbi:glycosyltransferase [Vermiphilus pyriformis]|uniref:Nucleotide-diphospho-sugar transferase domain-containing protein n=1 Tax=candidate division TM6 bacterium JCVI TM6SC1 TaxID=1306947 RepID=A0A0D2K5V4_9BACT|nr:hypothetical protein J120_01575 [candidate division TM6 bacterium JCVI TM6SC1]UNE35692.1 MAG: glycosyltransferase [Vermiphilus pyriformis]
MIKKLIMLINCLVCLSINAHVLIFTTAYNRPDFIELQYKSLLKYLKDDFEYVVFNDASQAQIHDNIVMTCESLKIKCISFPQHLHTEPVDLFLKPHIAPHRHSQVIQYAFDMLGFNHQGIVAVLDADLFLVDNLSITDYMKEYDLAGTEKNGILWDTFLPTSKYSFLWPVVFFFNMPKLPDRHTMQFATMSFDNHYFDSCGSLYFYLRDHPSLKIKYFDVVNLNAIPGTSPSGMFSHYHHNPVYYTLNDTKNRHLLEILNFKEREIKFIQSGPVNIQYYLENKFFHYMSASNYDQKTEDFHRIKTELFNQYMKEVLN